MDVCKKLRVLAGNPMNMIFENIRQIKESARIADYIIPQDQCIFFRGHNL